jgi:hypothetical protein
VPKNHDDTLKHEIEQLVRLGVLKRCSDSEWAAPTIIIPKKMVQSDLYLILGT